MRAVVQRVASASVRVDGEIVGAIQQGLLVLLGVEPQDISADVAYMADKTANLRIFEDDAGKMNLSVMDIGGAVLAVSQFTLLGDCRKGRRPAFTGAAPPELANVLYEEYVAAVRQLGLPVETGVFRAQMEVSLLNDGPVTLLLDSRKQF
ncbi:D-aminoacyl-tRNA deacylase [Blastopirellula sp. J2-11]|uniref:D-aminoacyl-tRNA deacylase n=1 Tax=Blastopirellula sp. J2-11 TaxID=2943192 RepID=UPI0021C8C0DF|nr:D-aminoacyl-tRNA deacylase [Blastopirellula sp. J2-11]UUO08268.1 D-aminoacyl-tRNA deacylase [Blastopirellula sp. J2-11]